MQLVKNAINANWEVTLGFRESDITLSVDTSYPEARVAELGAGALERVHAAWPRIEKKLLAKLHRLYNDVWAAPEAGLGRRTAKAFLAAIRLRTILVMDAEPALSLYFDAGELFAGHSIEIFWPTPDDIRDGELAG